MIAHSRLRAATSDYSVVSWTDNQLGEIIDALQYYGYWNEIQ